MAHTPGPWRALPEHGRIVLNGSAIYGVADITGEYANWNPDDLRLMAAAPELLAVAKLAFDYAQDTKARFIDHWDGEDAESYDKLCDAIDAAINKAEGGE